jgi:hypothetical protein
MTAFPALHFPQIFAGHMPKIREHLRVFSALICGKNKFNCRHEFTNKNSSRRKDNTDHSLQIDCWFLAEARWVFAVLRCAQVG